MPSDACSPGPWSGPCPAHWHKEWDVLRLLAFLAHTDGFLEMKLLSTATEIQYNSTESFSPRGRGGGDDDATRPRLCSPFSPMLLLSQT